MMNVVEHLLLITAPVRGGQQMSRTISGDTVNYHLRWHMLNTADENVGIFIEESICETVAADNHDRDRVSVSRCRV